MSLSVESISTSKKRDLRKGPLTKVVSAIFTFTNGYGQDTVLLVRDSNNILSLPGGLINPKEKDSDAISRNVCEMFPNLTLTGRFRWIFSKIAMSTIYNNLKVKSDIYLYEGLISGKENTKEDGIDIKVFYDLDKVKESKEIDPLTKSIIAVYIEKLKNKRENKKYKLF